MLQAFAKEGVIIYDQYPRQWLASP